MSRKPSAGLRFVFICQTGLGLTGPAPVPVVIRLLGPPPPATISLALMVAVPQVARLRFPAMAMAAQESFQVDSGMYDFADVCVVAALVVFQKGDGTVPF